MPINYPIFNTDPNVQSQAALLDQRQALAQALMQNGMSPLQGQQAGAVYVGPSWTQALGHMLSIYGGSKMLQQTALDRGALAAQAYDSALKANQPQTPPSITPDQVSSAATDALAQGASQPTPDIGPTKTNAQRMASMLIGAQPANPGTPPNPRNPLNLPAELITNYQAGIIPKEVFDAQAALYKPTDATLAARQGGLDTVSANQQQFAKNTVDPEILKLQQAGFTPQQIYAYMQSKAQKDTYIAPIDAKPGTPVLDPRTFEVKAFAPKMADGINATFANVDGVTQPVRANAIPGYAGSNASIAGAESGARAANSITSVTLPTGESVPVWAGPAARVGGSQAGLAGGGGVGGVSSSPAVTATPAPAGGQSAIPSPAGVQPQNRPVAHLGQSTTNASIQKDAASIIGNAPQIVQQSKSAVTGLEAALNQVEQGIKTGPGTAKTVNALAILNNAGIPLLKGDVDGYQTLQKFLQNSLNQAAQGTGASGSDARFESFMHGQPNAETMNPTALRGAIRYVLSQHDAAIARGQFLTQAYQAAAQAGDPNAALTAQSKWSNVYRPDFFAFNRMSPEDQAAKLRSLGNQAPAFVKQYNNYAASTGWVH